MKKRDDVLIIVFLVLLLIVLMVIAVAPTITLNSPANASISTLTYRELNVTVNDQESDVMNVSIYGDNSTLKSEELLAYYENIANSTITYNWNSPTVWSIYKNDNTLIAYWKFDKNASDVVGRANYSGIITGATQNASGGKLGGAIDCDGTGDKVVPANSTGLDGNKELTVSLWAKSKPDTRLINSIIHKFATTDDTRSWLLRYRPASGGTLEAFVRDSNNVQTGLTPATAIGLGTDENWHHLAFTASFNTGNFTLYHNGSQLDVVTTLDTSKTQKTALTQDVTICGLFSGTTDFNGTIDEVSIFNRSLSASEISYLYSLQNSTYNWYVNVSDGGSTTESSQVKFMIGEDTTKPNVSDVRPSLSSDYNLSQVIEMAANSTDDWALDVVLANITMPNASTTVVTLSATGAGNKFNNTYTTPSLRGLYNVTFYANDTSNNLNDSITTNFTADASPGITISSPTNNSGSTTGNITFNYNATDFTSISNCSLLINGVINITNTSITKEVTQNFTIINLPAGGYNVSVNCTDSSGNVGTVPAITTAVFRDSSFSGLTTNLDNIDCSNISNLVFEDTIAGRINFTANVNLCSGGNFDTYINISSNNIFVNSSALSMLNTSATLRLNNLTFSNPLILRDNTSCPTSICTKDRYSGGNLTFNVTSFSTYSASEGGSVSGPLGSTKEINPAIGGSIDVPEELINSGATFQPGVSRRIALNKIKDGEIVRFPFKIYDSSQHHITVEQIDVEKQEAILTLQSNPITGIFKINETNKFDLNGNGLYETSVMLQEIKNDNTIIVKVTTFSEESITPGEVPTIITKTEVANISAKNFTQELTNILTSKENKNISEKNSKKTEKTGNLLTGRFSLGENFDVSDFVDFSAIKEETLKIYGNLSRNSIILIGTSFLFIILFSIFMIRKIKEASSPIEKY